MNFTASFRSFFIIFCIVSFSLLYVGCGGSEETMAEDEMVTDTGESEEMTTDEEQPVDGEQTDEAQTTEETPQEEQPLAVEETPVQQPEGPSREQLQVELDSLKTENVQLKDQLTSNEQTSRDLAAKISDLEAANAAIKQQMSQRPAKSTAVAHSTSPGKSSHQEIQIYESAVSRFNSKNYSDAISELQTLLNTGIKDDYADNCHYWIGVSYFQTRDYSSAMQHFQQVLAYRYSEKKDDAQLMVAQCYERQGEKDQAQAEYRKLVEMYPTSEYIGRARARMR